MPIKAQLKRLCIDELPYYSLAHIPLHVSLKHYAIPSICLKAGLVVLLQITGAFAMR